MTDAVTDSPTGHAPLALVVGGGSGIGAAVAAQHRAAGTPTVVWDVAGPRDVTCDVLDPDAVDDAVATTVADHGMPTWITVSAGIGHSGLLLDAPAEDWDRVVGVNARGAWLVMRAVVRALRDDRQGGSIVAISSVSSHLADRTMGLYCASKAALDMIVRVAAVEWAPLGVRVNAVGPGVTQTPMLGGASSGSSWLAAVEGRTALGRLGRADDIAQTVLAVHGMSWVTGQAIDCDGGLSLHSPLDPYGHALRERSTPRT